MNPTALDAFVQCLDTSQDWDGCKVVMKTTVVALHEALSGVLATVAILSNRLDSFLLLQGADDLRPTRKAAKPFKKLSTHPELDHRCEERPDIIRHIWDLFNNLQFAKQKAQTIHTSTLARTTSTSPRPSSAPRTDPRDRYLEHAVSEVSELLESTLDKNKLLISNYFTREEKLHLGTSLEYPSAPPAKSPHRPHSPCTLR
eukprot:NODE_2442_length_696_cov_13.310665_g1992_i0.p1 GENE.NODE_2442_length_696_cov_13.310665_g1992_i0~~NODE_2442_length_696_cov_13.310665_g1992_i0.p1  ORF type:complete len:201 (-),score=46.54 NODE_2442_length_696_cov_13.310665_g1992_i0:3-605(-)